MHTVLGAGGALGEPLVALLGSPAHYCRFGFLLSDEYQITPPRPHRQPHFQVRTLTAYQPALRGPFAYAEPFDRTQRRRPRRIQRSVFSDITGMPEMPG